ncbi:TetR/AcrR family transcriptional regulator [Aeromicrobium panaciterrae]
MRDIAKEAGVSHAAIGYHFGSRENLLIQALFESIEELGGQVELEQAASGPEGRWQALTDSFVTHRALWVAQIEAIAQAQQVPALRERLAEAQRHSREAFGGSVPLALLLGLMVQSLIDPDTAPSVGQLQEELKTLAEHPGRLP